MVEVKDVKGYEKRDEGEWMMVERDKIFRKIGGGKIEYMEIEKERKIIYGGSEKKMDVKLGKEIGK